MNLSKKIVAITIFIMAAILSISLPCIADDTIVITDSPGYGPGEVLTVFGAGWQAGETVTLALYTDINPNSPYVTLNSIADSNGFFINTDYTIQPQDSGRTFTLITTGQTSGFSAQTVFDDAPHVHLFEDSSRTVFRDAFAWGATLYARGDDLGTTKPCWQIQWIDPNNTIVATHNLDAASTNNRDDSFTLLPGPSGIWRAELWEPDTSGSDCSVENFTLRSTEYFDVAQIVLIGAANDGYVVQNLPNFNSDTSLLFFRLDVQSCRILGVNCNEWTFIHYDLSSVSGPVVSSKLRMLLYNPPASSRTYNIQRVIANWSEGALTWNLPPAVDGIITNAQTIGTIPSLIRWDVTTDVTGFMNSTYTNYGWRIKDTVDNNSPSRQGHFWSSEWNTFTGQKNFGPVLLIDNLRSTSTTVSCTSPVLIGQGTTCTATVTDTTGAGASAPTGTVTFSTDSTGGFSDPGVACTLVPIGGDSSSCTVTYTPLVAGNHAIGADYGGSLVHSSSSAVTDFNITANIRPATTTVNCASPLYVNQGTTCTATVTDAGGAGASAPTGTITFSTSASGNFSNPGAVCPLAPVSGISSSCSVTYTPTLAGIHVISAAYNGSSIHTTSAAAGGFPLDARVLPVPAMTDRGIIVLCILAGLLSVAVLKKRQA
jgi:hypothetical protein